MSDQLRLLASVKLGEGYRPNPYQDTRGLWTVGYGDCLEEQPWTASDWRALLAHGDVAVSLSQAGAERILSQALARVAAQCDTAWPWWARLNDARQNVLIEMTFNLGLRGVLGFHQMLDALAANDFEDAAAQMLDSTWSRQVGDRAQRLARQMREGTFL